MQYDQLINVPPLFCNMNSASKPANRALNNDANVLPCKQFTVSFIYVTTPATRPVTSLGHQEGRRVFREGPKFFEPCPIFLNYVQHIFPGWAKIFLGLASPPWLRVCPQHSQQLFSRDSVVCFLEIAQKFVDTFCMFPRFFKTILGGKNLVCSTTPRTKTALVILQRLFTYFAAPFFKAMSYIFPERLRREIP